jgi:hypothetical protein
MTKKKKPDMVVLHPESMKYPTNVGAPAFTVPDVLRHKQERGVNATHYLETKFEQLKREYFALVQLAEDTNLVYNAKFNFIPVVGKTYHLYMGYTNEPFLTLIGPTEWSTNREKDYLGSFRYTSENIWERVEG